VPAAYPFRYYATDGGLMAYGIDDSAPFEYADRIFKGAKPGDLPVQRPPKFHRVVNMGTGKAPGIEVSPSLLATADEVIE
jgi:putative ABC transport system substrate-binding protein